MFNHLDDVTAKALKNARQQAFEQSVNVGLYADGIDAKANENNDGVLDIADLADENSTSITDLAEYVAELEERIAALEGGE